MRRCLSYSLRYRWSQYSPLGPLPQIMAHREIEGRAHIWKSHLCFSEYSVLAVSKQLLSGAWWGKRSGCSGDLKWLSSRWDLYPILLFPTLP